MLIYLLNGIILNYGTCIKGLLANLKYEELIIKKLRLSSSSSNVWIKNFLNKLYGE